MEAKELRIGNKFLGMGMVQTVFAIMDNTNKGQFNQAGYEHLILCKENGNQYKPIEIDPIPLTSEILEKAGFEKERHPTQDGDCDFWKIPERSNFELEQYVKNGEITFCGHDYVRVTSLHQLQNLYFALTQTELTINL